MHESATSGFLKQYVNFLTDVSAIEVDGFAIAQRQESVTPLFLFSIIDHIGNRKR